MCSGFSKMESLENETDQRLPVVHHDNNAHCKYQTRKQVRHTDIQNAEQSDADGYDHDPADPRDFNNELAMSSGGTKRSICAADNVIAPWNKNTGMAEKIMPMPSVDVRKTAISPSISDFVNSIV